MGTYIYAYSNPLQPNAICTYIHAAKSHTAHTSKHTYTLTHLQNGVDDGTHWECVLRRLHYHTEAVHEDGDQELDNTVHIVVFSVGAEQGRGLQE